MKTTFFGEILGKTGNPSLPWGRSPGNLFLDKFWLNLDKFWLNLDKCWLNLDKLGLKWIKSLLYSDKFGRIWNGWIYPELLDFINPLKNPEEKISDIRTCILPEIFESNCHAGQQQQGRHNGSTVSAANSDVYIRRYFLTGCGLPHWQRSLVCFSVHSRDHTPSFDILNGPLRYLHASHYRYDLVEWYVLGWWVMSPHCCWTLTLLSIASKSCR